jgi:hypothetical protein
MPHVRRSIVFNTRPTTASRPWLFIAGPSDLTGRQCAVWRLCRSTRRLSLQLTGSCLFPICGYAAVEAWPFRYVRRQSRASQFCDPSRDLLAVLAGSSILSAEM